MRKYTVNGKMIDSLEDLPEGTSQVVAVSVRTENDMPKEGAFTGNYFLNKESVLICIRALIAANRKIPAIKLVRSYTGWGLRESKDFVDCLSQVETYPCEIYLYDGWTNVGQKTIEEAIALLENENTNVSLKTGKDTWVTLWYSPVSGYGITKDGEGLTTEMTDRETAIKLFREQF